MESFKVLIDSGVCISCDTREKCDYLSMKLNKLGYKWTDGRSYTDICYFNHIGKVMCYFPKGGQAASIDYWERDLGKEVVTLESLFPNWNVYMSNRQISVIIDKYV